MGPSLCFHTVSLAAVLEADCKVARFGNGLMQSFRGETMAAGPIRWAELRNWENCLWDNGRN